MRRRTVLVALTAAMVLGAGTASAMPRVIEASAPMLHPEGVAWDPSRHAFLVGSAAHGTVSIVRPNGRVTTLWDDPVPVSALGLKVDVARNRVLVAYADLGFGGSTKVQSGLGIFDLTTGRTLHMVDLLIGPGRHGANDVTLDRAGNAYVTDPASDTIYKVDVLGRASVYARDPRLGSTAIGNNGIAWHPDGYLVVGMYTDGKLLRVKHNRVDEVRLDRPVVGADGIAFRPDGALLVVTNALASTGRNAVFVVRSGDGWSSARVAREVAWPTTSPTTVTVTPFGSYVVSGNLEKLIAGTPVDDFRLDRL